MANCEIEAVIGKLICAGIFIEIIDLSRRISRGAKLPEQPRTLEIVLVLYQHTGPDDYASFGAIIKLTQRHALWFLLVSFNRCHFMQK